MILVVFLLFFTLGSADLLGGLSSAADDDIFGPVKIHSPVPTVSPTMRRSAVPTVASSNKAQGSKLSKSANPSNGETKKTQTIIIVIVVIVLLIAVVGCAVAYRYRLKYLERKNTHDAWIRSSLSAPPPTDQIPQQLSAFSTPSAPAFSIYASNPMVVDSPARRLSVEPRAADESL